MGHLVLLSLIYLWMSSCIGQKTDLIADVEFLVDGSSEVSDSSFQYMKDLIVAIAKGLPIAPKKIRLGITQFSDDIKREIPIGATQFQTRASVLKFVERSLLKSGGNRMMGRALLDIHSALLQEPAQNRRESGIPAFLVVFTGGASQDQVQHALTMIRELGVRIITVGFQEYNAEELNRMSSSHFIFQRGSRATVAKDIVNALRDQIQNPDTTIDDVKFASCDVGEVDLQFFIHFSEDDNLPHIKDFLEKIINAFSSDIRVGLQFIPSQTSGFTLKMFEKKSKILEQVRALHQRGMRPLGNDLKDTLARAAEHFSTGSGGRANLKVPQVAVLITDDAGTASLQNAAYNLYHAGVTVYTVAVNIADSSKLFYVTSYPPENTFFTADSFQQLATLQQNLLDKICYHLSYKYEDYWKMRNAAEKSCSKLMKADIYFLIDGSRNIPEKQFDEVEEFLNETAQYFTLRPSGVRFGVVQYSTKSRAHLPIGTFTNRKDLKCGVHMLVQEDVETNVEEGFEYVEKQLSMSKRPNVPQYLVVLLEGKKNLDDRKFDTSLVLLKNNAVTMFSVGVDEETLQKVSTPQGKYFKISNFVFLKDIVLHLAQSICESAALYSTEADIVFLLDSSSNTVANFGQMKDLLKVFVQTAVDSDNNVRLGVVQFSNTVRQAFGLGTYSSTEQLQQAINGLPRLQGQARTGQALQSVARLFRVPQANPKKILVVITDGQTNDDASLPAADLRNSGIDIYAIGSVNANKDQLVEITGSPLKVFLMANNLSDVASVLKDEVQMECQNTEIADIAFVIDINENTEVEKFDNVKKFLISVLRAFDIGFYNVRVALSLNGDVSREGFDLLKYQNMDLLQQAIENLNLRNVKQRSENVQTAIESSRELLLDSHGGRRQYSVPQFLVTITDRDSTDSTQLAKVCEDVRASGVHTIAVGIDTNVADLQIIGGSDDHYFEVQTFEDLEHETWQMTEHICSIPYCNTTLLDVVFLIDGSESISKDDFSLEKNFTKRIVGSFDANDNVRVGLAQFSSHCSIVFNLKSFPSKSDFDMTVDGVNQFREGTRIARALETSRAFFTPNERRYNVTPHLIILTDGEDTVDSADHVAEQARLLREEDHVTIVVVAVGDEKKMNSVLLNRIADNPANVIRATTHNDLAGVVPRIVRAVCDTIDCNKTVEPTPIPLTPTFTPTPPPPKDCLIDIAVGIDITERQGQHLLLYHRLLRTSLLPALRVISDLRLPSCSSDFRVRFGFHIPNTEPPYETDFQPFNEDIMKELESRVILQPSSANGPYLLSFAEKFRKSDSHRYNHKQVILIFTDGLDASQAELRNAVNSLRQEGIDGLVTVALEGISKEASQQLHNIEFGPFGSGPCCRAQLYIGDTIVNDLKAAFVTFTEDACCRCCICVGPPGPRGDRGKEGVKGGPGEEGAYGHVGDDGHPGTPGERGKEGIAGHNGCDGAQGLKGHRGLTGERGEHGYDGWDGIQGEQGEEGRSGTKGLKGDPGNQGDTGPKGKPGDKGEKGLRGDPGTPGSDSTVAGPKGETGLIGLEGDNGEDGLKGENGDPGYNGREGKRGSPGIKGVKGTDGVEGLPGEIGPAGPQGPRGPVGARGIPGEAGNKGPQGSQGLQGVQGNAGNEGSRGAKGEAGDPGDKGNDGDRGMRGLPGIDGQDGFGPPGQKGRMGTPGIYGPTGLQGEYGDKGLAGWEGPKGHRGAPGLRGVKGNTGDPGDPGHGGRKGPGGMPGVPELSYCDLKDFIRDNCACSGCRECPNYPLDLVVAYDMWDGVPDFQFSNAKELIMDVVNSSHISESTCPSGARVAVVSFSSGVRRVIRFTDYRSKKKLLQLIAERVVYETDDGQLNLGEAMSYTARHMFKRTRGGKSVKKMAFFLAGMFIRRGDDRTSLTPQETEDLYSAVMELYANDITPVIVTSNPVNQELLNAFSNFPGQYEIIAASTNPEQIMARLRECFICYDFCHPSPRCESTRPVPINLNTDALFLLDGSHGVSKGEFQQAQKLLSGIVDRFARSPSPPSAQMRLALVQQRGYTPKGEEPVKVEFDFLQHEGNWSAMTQHFHHSLSQLHGSLTLGQALEHILDRFPANGSRPTATKVIVTFVGGSNDPRDLKRLREMALKAKCNGYILFTVVLGKDVQKSEVDLLSNPPVSIHSIQMDGAGTSNVAYAVRYTEAFFRLLPRRPFNHPRWTVQDQCEWARSEDISGFGALPDENEVHLKQKSDAGSDTAETKGVILQAEQPQSDWPQESFPAENKDILSPVEMQPLGQHLLSQVDPGMDDPNLPTVLREKSINAFKGPQALQHDSPGAMLENKNQTNVSEQRLKSKQLPKNSSKEDMITTSNLPAHCLQRKHYGSTCKEAQGIRWYFHKQTKRCGVFWYGGCGGNGNRFISKAECRRACATQRS